jgi:hypothetical protein
MAKYSERSVRTTALMPWRPALVAATVISCLSCSPPTPALNAIVPNSGYPRQLLAVDGTTLYASVVWDPGPSERVLYNGLFGTSYFQIPTDATPGPHSVAIRNSNGTSALVPVNVLPYEDFRDDPTTTTPYFPPPRVEDVALLLAAGNGPINLALTVAAANLDVNATVAVAEINDAQARVERLVSATVRWGALPVDYLQNHKPSTFGYPVYHYAQLLSVVENVTLGSTLEVTVENTDGKTSTRTLSIPHSLDQLDADGDGLRDAWEDVSYPVSGRAISLSAMGTRKWRKDVLVEVDWIADAQPHPDLWQHVEAAFAEAPVLNPDGSRGVNVIIDRGQGGALGNGGETLADHDCLTFEDPAPAGNTDCPTLKSLFDYKRTNFDADRLLIFHYAVLGRQHVNLRYGGEGERHGNDFFLTPLGNPFWTDVEVQVGMLVHELGHNLGFSHGDLKSDDQDFPRKPNLPSVMNYRYTWFGANGDCTTSTGGIYSYSQGTLARLAEAHVDEQVGICDGIPADLNGDSVESMVPLTIDIDEDGDTTGVSDDFDQWGNLLLRFDVNSNWSNN